MKQDESTLWKMAEQYLLLKNAKEDLELKLKVLKKGILEWIKKNGGDNNETITLFGEGMKLQRQIRRMITLDESFGWSLVEIHPEIRKSCVRKVPTLIEKGFEMEFNNGKITKEEIEALLKEKLIEVLSIKKQEQSKEIRRD